MVLGISGGAMPPHAYNPFFGTVGLFILVTWARDVHFWRCFHFNHSFLDNFLVSSYPSTERYRQRFLFICLLNTPYRLCRIKSRTGRSCFTATIFFLCPFPDSRPYRPVRNIYCSIRQRFVFTCTIPKAQIDLAVWVSGMGCSCKGTNN